MKTIPFLLLILLTGRAHAETSAAASPEFSLELGSARSVAAVTSAEFPLDVRDKGGVGSSGSAEFALDTTAMADGWVEVSAPANVASGSVNPVLVTWHYGTNSTRIVTSQVRWVFLNDPAGSSYFSGGELHAGVVSVPTSMTVAAVYETIGGISRQSAPVTITVLPGLQGKIAAAQQGNTGLVTFAAEATGGSGNLTVRWDTDLDGQFDDVLSPSISMNYGTTTGTMSVSAKITDGAGGEIIRKGFITINKPPLVNQPLVIIPAVDPQGFELFKTDGSYEDYSPDPARKDNGLVVIVHGLWSDAKESWLREMTDAIEQRCISEGKGRPNIALMDWSRDAKTPAPTSYASEIFIASVKWYLHVLKQKRAAAFAGAGETAVKFAVELWAVRDLGLRNGQLLANWTYDNSRLASSPSINADAPIHFIGHSAGGFVCAEAARLLKHPRLPKWQPVYVDRVTMLDTPFPIKRLIGNIPDGFPNPGVAEHFASSFYGTLPAWDARNMPSHLWFRPVPIFKSENLTDLLDPNENGHGWSYKWYTEKTTNPNGELLSDGFYFSPIINPATRIPKPYTPPSAMAAMEMASTPGLQTTSASLPDIVPAGWETFGSANESSGTWTFTESADAGI